MQPPPPPAAAGKAHPYYIKEESKAPLAENKDQQSSFMIWNLVQARLNALHGGLRELFQNKILLICR